MSSLAIRKYAFTTGISLLLPFCLGCSLNAIGNFGNTLIEAANDVNIFTDEEELQFGKAFVAHHEKEVKLYKDPVVTNYINDLGQIHRIFSKSSVGFSSHKKIDSLLPKKV